MSAPVDSFGLRVSNAVASSRRNILLHARDGRFELSLRLIGMSLEYTGRSAFAMRKVAFQLVFDEIDAGAGGADET